MANFVQMSNRFKSLNLDQIYTATMSNQTEEILEQNRQQMLEGKTSEGTNIKPKYKNKSYEKRTQNKQRLGGIPDLKLSGGFHADLSLKKENTNFVFKSSLGYVNEFVLPKYDDVLGLEPKRQKEFNNETFQPEYVEKIKKHLQIF